ncbi:MULTISPECIES: hypothetical protein [Clostridium]|uniref:Glycine zipper-like domain-containing protein n=1 Tax=Clostridium ragsdalei P11 TaxID=1353534 RepID=A0A1A6B362_9CLOT|nr:MULTISPECIES: hypothetical protein [Clostridium]OBR96720.1 hypothetical protein CLRAG_02280 [Clostridium ragsdalei P11]
MEQNEGENKKSYNYLAVGISLGIVFGTSFHNLALGISIGAALGIALSNNKTK